MVNVVIRAQRVVSECSSESCLSARTVLPWAALALSVALALAVSRLFGPVLASAAEGFWLLDTPDPPGPSARPAAGRGAGGGAGRRGPDRGRDHGADRWVGRRHHRLVGGDRAGRDVGRLLRRRPAGRRATPADGRRHLPVRRPGCGVAGVGGRHRGRLVQPRHQRRRRRGDRVRGHRGGGRCCSRSAWCSRSSGWAASGVPGWSVAAPWSAASPAPSSPSTSGSRGTSWSSVARSRSARCVPSEGAGSGGRRWSGGSGSGCSGSRSRCSCWPSPSSSRTPATPWG